MPSTTPNQKWFEIRYTEAAPAGLPPLLQAEQVIRYADEQGTWLVALWSHDNSAASGVSSCIFRIREAHIAAISAVDAASAGVRSLAVEGGYAK